MFDVCLMCAVHLNSDHPSSRDSVATSGSVHCAQSSHRGEGGGLVAGLRGWEHSIGTKDLRRVWWEGWPLGESDPLGSWGQA